MAINIEEAVKDAQCYDDLFAGWIHEHLYEWLEAHFDGVIPANTDTYTKEHVELLEKILNEMNEGENVLYTEIEGVMIWMREKLELEKRK